MALNQRLFLFCLIATIVKSHPCYAFKDVFIMNTSLIVNACQGLCDDSQTEEALAQDCYRGCRLFDSLTRPSPYASEEVIALGPCNACIQAYSSENLKRDSPQVQACIEGCQTVSREFSKVHKLSMRWLRETQRHMGFFETLLEITTMMMTPYARSVDASRFMEQVPDKGNKKRWKVKTSLLPKDNSNTTVSILTEEELQNASPPWVSQTAIALFGIFTLALMGFSCYVCIWARQDHAMGFNDFPPTYEDLMNKGKELRNFRASSGIYA